MEITTMKLDDIKKYEFNAKLHPQEQIDQIKKSIETFGFNDPIAVDQDNVIIEGHGRFEAVCQLGYTSVPVIKLEHLTEEQRNAYILVHNKITMNTNFDKDMLENELDNILDINMSEFDFNHFILGDDIEEFGSIILEEKKAPDNINSAPLPFQGQKRGSIAMFIEKIEQYYDDSYIFVDLFGGSGLLSAKIRELYPDAKIYYNDFDDYVLRCQNIDITNELLGKIWKIINDAEVPKKAKIPTKIKHKIVNLFTQYEYIDYLTISSRITFTSSHVHNLEQLKKATLYNNMTTSLYNSNYVKSFHNDLIITKIDWKKNIEKWKDNPKVVFIADPPYLATNVETYSESQEWNIYDFLLINNELKGTNQIFFTSDKSNIMHLDKYLQDFYNDCFFHNKDIHTNLVNCGGGGIQYRDYMVFSFAEHYENKE